MGKLKTYLIFLKQINKREFIYLNFISKQVIRTDNSKIIPYKGSVIDISKESKIYLSGGDFEIGCDKLRKSKAETLIRMRGKSIISLTKGARISYGVTIEVLDNALLDTQYFTMNTGSVMVVNKKIILGEDVMIGRNVILYDSDFHRIEDSKGNLKEKSEIVKIGNHVWITSNAMILKGTCIGDNSIVSATSLVKGELSSNIMYSNNKIIANYGNWFR